MIHLNAPTHNVLSIDISDIFKKYIQKQSNFHLPGQCHSPTKHVKTSSVYRTTATYWTVGWSVEQFLVDYNVNMVLLDVYLFYGVKNAWIEWWLFFPTSLCLVLSYLFCLPMSDCCFIILVSFCACVIWCIALMSTLVNRTCYLCNFIDCWAQI